MNKTYEILTLNERINLRNKGLSRLCKVDRLDLLRIITNPKRNKIGILERKLERYYKR